MRKGVEAINPFSGVLDEELNEMVLGDKVILLDRFVGSVVFECGAYGIGFDEPLDWDYIESQIEPVTGCDNSPAFCRNDNFVSLWELLWNFNCEEDVCTVVKIDFDARRGKEGLFRALNTVNGITTDTEVYQAPDGSIWAGHLSDFPRDEEKPEGCCKVTVGDILLE